jgi:hypothetical protein
MGNWTVLTEGTWDWGVCPDTVGSGLPADSPGLRSGLPADSPGLGSGLLADSPGLGSGLPADSPGSEDTWKCLMMDMKGTGTYREGLRGQQIQDSEDN